MTGSYQRFIEYWDNVFSKAGDSVSNQVSLGNIDLENALLWLCEGSRSVIDFGCGRGSMLFFCAQNGTQEHLGIDLSSEAIVLSQRRAETHLHGSFAFQQGGVEALSNVPQASFDAMILSNIIDNLYPDDAKLLLSECARIVKPGGKLFVKLNPFLTPEQIVEWKIKTISGNLLDDGLLLWNNTTEQWRSLLEKDFSIVHEGTIYYPEHDMINRSFYLNR